MRRTEARELLMQLIFEAEAQQDFGIGLYERYKEENMDGSDQLPYFEKTWKSFCENRTSVDELITKYSNGWNIPRLGKVDLAVLRLCITEIVFLSDKDVPVGASINEAVNLAKKYGDEGSGKFVNGILGRISREEGKA